MEVKHKDYSEFGIDIPYGRRSGKIKTICPQCHDQRSNKRDKSLSVDLDKGVWHCHYCNWSGTNEVRVKDDWQVKATIRKQKKVYKLPAAQASEEQRHQVGAKALAWFASRGISEQTLRALNVTEGLEWMPQTGKPENTVQFNYYRGEELVNVKYRTGRKEFKLVSGAELLPYNINAIGGTPECIITEGEMDTLSFVECGRLDVVSVPNGANANLEYLDDYLEQYFDDKEVIYIAVDTDTKGVVLRDELMRRFGAERCRVVEYGEGCKDANEHLIKYGKASLLKCLADAPETKIDGVFTITDFEGSLDALFERGWQPGVTIGHPNFDALCSFETKRLCIVTGIPGSGKSEFIDEIAERLNVRYGWRFAYFSPENAPLAYHASKLIEKFTGRRFSKSSLSNVEYKKVKEHLESDFFFISPTDSFKVDNILEKAKALVRRKGIKALVIDPYNRLESEQGTRSETQYISELLDKLTNFAQRNDLLVILMAHPTKQPRNKDGIIEAPTLYDISGSANFFNKADFGIVVHRNRQANNVEVHVQKVKFRHLGQCGTALFHYNLNNGRYVPYVQDILPSWDNASHLDLIDSRNIEEVKASTAIPFATDSDPLQYTTGLSDWDTDGDRAPLPF
ncbi:bifunctional DNA primase/helicase [Porphyromonas sp. oral taxon 278]|uniref:bifunctional DNA primase/helicase n=1 Tax=Porphyromonas sp. oral taxon 278 TaxID=712437 RepID=UPI0025D4F10D|nr:bifunctional DNA primase/helicase [Porphyromonas sp. oral taxon 278]